MRRYGDLEAAEDFLAIGKEVDMRDPEGRTPLFFAVAYNHAAIVEELLRAGADVHARARPLRYVVTGAAARIMLHSLHADPQPRTV